MNDADFLYSVLNERPGEWVAHWVILQRSQIERGHGLTVHSRAATLRERGFTVECEVCPSLDGQRRVSFYRLAPLAQPASADIRGSSLGDAEKLHVTGPETGYASGASDNGGAERAIPPPNDAPAPLVLFETPTEAEVPAWA